MSFKGEDIPYALFKFIKFKKCIQINYLIN